MNNDEVLRNIEARLKRIEELLLAQDVKPKRHRRHIDPKLPHIMRQSMQEKGLSQSGLAALMFGRRINSAGVNDAIGKDRISVWLAGKSYPSDRHLARLGQFVDVV